MLSKLIEMISKVCCTSSVEIPSSPVIEKALYTYQTCVDTWMRACFGSRIAYDRIERNHRFIEEALELVQACGCSQDEAHQMVDYVYGRPVGSIHQEIGGVMVTLAALCTAQGRSMVSDGETELQSAWERINKIRAKQAAKPKFSPLPGPSSSK